MKFQRSMYWAFLFLIAGGVGAFLNQAFGWARAGAEPQRSGPVEDLRVRTLVVEDSEGRPRIRLGVDRDGSPYFMMRNQEGVDVFSIHSKGKLGSMITLSHPDWVNGLQMMVHPERGPLLALSDREGKIGIGIAAGPDRRASFMLFDQNEKGRASLTLTPDNTVGLTFFGKDMESQLALLALENGKKGLVLFDRENRMPLSVHVLPGGQPEMILKRKNGAVLWRSPVSAPTEEPPGR